LCPLTAIASTPLRTTSSAPLTFCSLPTRAPARSASRSSENPRSQRLANALRGHANDQAEGSHEIGMGWSASWDHLCSRDRQFRGDPGTGLPYQVHEGWQGALTDRHTAILDPEVQSWPEIPSSRASEPARGRRTVLPSVDSKEALALNDGARIMAEPSGRPGLRGSSVSPAKEDPRREGQCMEERVERRERPAPAGLS